jgi:transcriptional regulator with XRE-family HTH domain
MQTEQDPLRLRLAYLRRRAEMTQTALGEAIGRRCTVQQFEEGRTKRLYAADVVKWLDAVNASPAERKSIAAQWLAEGSASDRRRSDGEAEIRRLAGVEGV